MGDAAGWVGVGVSGVAVVVSIAALWKSSLAQRKANAAQQRIVEIEEHREKDRLAVGKRAELRAELRKTARGTSRLYVINEGPAGARNVAVSLDEKPLLDHEAGGAELTSTIGPHSEVSCILSVHSTCAPPLATSGRLVGWLVESRATSGR